MLNQTVSDFRQFLEGQSSPEVAQTVASLTQSHRQRMEALAQLEAEVTASRRALAVAEEVLAERRADLEPGYVERWRELLDTTSRQPDNAARRHRAYDEFIDEHRRPYLRGSLSVRVDNRQAVFALFPHTEEAGQEKTLLALLALLPILVYEASPDPAERAAIVRVMSQDLPDLDTLTLRLHPRIGRYELFRRGRSDEVLEHRTDCLRDMLTFLSTHHAYY